MAKPGKNPLLLGEEQKHKSLAPGCLQFSWAQDPAEYRSATLGRDNTSLSFPGSTIDLSRV